MFLGGVFLRASCWASMGPVLGPASHDSDDHPTLYPSGEACACPACVLGESPGFKPIIYLEPFSGHGGFARA